MRATRCSTSGARRRSCVQRAEDLGGTRVMGPVTSPDGLVVGHFKDPEGTLIGVAGPSMGAGRPLVSRGPRRQLRSRSWL